MLALVSVKTNFGTSDCFPSRSGSSCFVLRIGGNRPEDDGTKFLLNVQPVIPVSINDKWNVISRNILPIAVQDDIFPGAGSQTGLGDTVQSLFFSPKAPTSGGLIWVLVQF